ncbi:hypothetical protein B0H14DRAFT_3613459 [Mycena olivaceomarginata]|nr:hypothetical protein B0H14DRAFT_3613459 [Mycena olivaceomarginata]
MPLAVSLIAHLVDSEGCSNVLARWEREKISVISVGTDKAANLEISISLSLSSPRLNKHSRDLLSLLSMLPDGLSDVELVQSKLPIRNVLGCKAALIGTALAYSNEQKHLKALVPIREYMNKIQPPSENLIQPLFKHFQFLLKLFEDHRGSEKMTYVITEIFRSWRETRISDPDTLVTKGLNHFEHFDDPDLKCQFYICIAAYYQGSANDLVKAIEFCQAAVSLAHSTGNTKGIQLHCINLASMNKQIGDYSTAQLQAFEAQRLARISANLFVEVYALNIQARFSRIMPADQGGQTRGYALLNIAELGVHMGYPRIDISISTKESFREAKTIFEQCIKLWTGKYTDIIIYCLEQLGNVSCWPEKHSMSSWTVLFLALSLKSTYRLGIYQALQFLGDIFLSYNDEDTAVSLFTVALEGFTAMDVHRSRAECMLRLGDIHKRCNDLLGGGGAIGKLKKPLFKRSLQAKQIVQIDERLASVGKDVHQQHRENLVKLAELKISSGISDETEDGLEDENKDLDAMKLVEPLATYNL